MTNAIIGFGRGRLFHCYRFPEVDGALFKSLELAFLFIAIFIFVQTVK